MSNAELAAAIDYASTRIRMIAANESQYIAFVVHLEELLREQRRRAIKEFTGDPVEAAVGFIMNCPLGESASPAPQVTAP